MKLPAFEYLKPRSLGEALAALGSDDDAHVLAGGQSLLPLLALRLARPSLLVDIAGLGLDTVEVLTATADPPPPAANARRTPAAAGVERTVAANGGRWLATAPGTLRLGAMVRQRCLELDRRVLAACPLLADAARQVGYPATRNLGTLGGSLAHADPAAELPAVVVALGGRVLATGGGGERVIAGGELAAGYFTTTLAHDEVLTAIELPVAGPAHGAAWCEWAPRRHDFAESGVGVAIELADDGTCARLGAAACSLGGGPLDLSGVIASAGVLGARSLPPLLLGEVGRQVRGLAAEIDRDRAELTAMLAARACLLALERAGTRALEAAT